MSLKPPAAYGMIQRTGFDGHWSWESTGPAKTSSSEKTTEILLVTRHPHPSFHQPARAAAHERLAHEPLPALRARFRAHAQRPGRMAEADAAVGARTCGALH